MRRMQVGAAAAAGRRARFLGDVAQRAHRDARGVEGGGAGHGAREAGDKICPWDFQAEMEKIAGVLVRTVQLVCVWLLHFRASDGMLEGGRSADRSSWVSPERRALHTPIST